MYWAVLSCTGCVGLYWAILGCIGLYWAVLGYIGLYWAILGCTGLYWAALRQTQNWGHLVNFWCLVLNWCHFINFWCHVLNWCHFINFWGQVLNWCQLIKFWGHILNWCQLINIWGHVLLIICSSLTFNFEFQFISINSVFNFKRYQFSNLIFRQLTDMLVGERADYLERRAEELGATVEVSHF